MLISKVIRTFGPKSYIKSSFTRNSEFIKMSKYLENGVVRSRRVMIEGPNYNKYMEASYDSEGKYIKHSFFSSTNTVPRNLDFLG